ncbi:entericidin A/B family lipoprotein [Glaciimonas immobilis]|nr:entericidin A/B family lipoprotein [Glaciimonas immobilis]
MKKIVSIAAVLSLFSVLSACNTFAGMGKDVEAGGSKVHDAAETTKSKM